MEKVFEEIEKRLERIESYESKVFIVNKQHKEEFIAKYPNRIINPATQIERSTKIIFQNDEIEIQNFSLFFYGLYIKKTRNVSQTPMPGVEHAVSDIFKNFVDFYRADSFNFVPAGREDKDVLNIKGRPFYVELINPKANLFKTVPDEMKINEQVTLTDLTASDGRKVKKFILEGEQTHEKTYQLWAFCTEKTSLQQFFEENTSPRAKIPPADKIECLIGKKIELNQQTPLRVLHRRANLHRKRHLTILEYKIAENYLFLRLKAAAGTYIKEFVTGDLERTSPSLSSLLDCSFDCVQLDVEELENTKLPADCILEE